MSDDRAGIIRLAEEMMGWNVFGLERHGFDSGPAYETTILIENVECNWNVFGPRKDASNPRLWNPFESIADANELEAAIPEDKRWHYIMHLREIIDPTCYVPTVRMLWLIAHATPSQRAEAALAVLEAK